MKTDNGENTGRSFKELQKSTDTAINERIKKEKGTDKLDPENANNPKNRSRKTGTTSKKTGSGKQKNSGL